jgi:hypothetical protein
MEDINHKIIPQGEAENAVEQYYKAKYHKCLKPQKKVPKTNSFRRFRSQINKKELGIKKRRKSKSKSKSKRRSSRKSSNKKRKQCRIKKTRYTKDRKHYRKFSSSKKN